MDEMPEFWQINATLKESTFAVHISSTWVFINFQAPFPSPRSNIIIFEAEKVVQKTKNYDVTPHFLVQPFS